MYITYKVMCIVHKEPPGLKKLMALGCVGATKHDPALLPKSSTLHLQEVFSMLHLTVSNTGKEISYVLAQYRQNLDLVLCCLNLSSSS